MIITLVYQQKVKGAILNPAEGGTRGNPVKLLLTRIAPLYKLNIHSHERLFIYRDEKGWCYFENLPELWYK